MATTCECTGKFVSLETGNPEVNSEELSDGQVSIEIRLTRNCAECSEEKKEAIFNLEADHSEDILKHENDFHPGKEAEITYSLELDDPESTESGGGRYAKNMIGVSVHYTILCDSCTGDQAKVV